MVGVLLVWRVVYRTAGNRVARGEVGKQFDQRSEIHRRVVSLRAGLRNRGAAPFCSGSWSQRTSGVAATLLRDSARPASGSSLGGTRFIR